MRWSLGRLFSGEGCLPLILVEKFIYLFGQQAFTRHLFCVRHSALCRRRRVPESSRGLFKHSALLAARFGRRSAVGFETLCFWCVSGPWCYGCTQSTLLQTEH